jgi:hypothetical protein
MGEIVELFLELDIRKYSRAENERSRSDGSDSGLSTFSVNHASSFLSVLPDPNLMQLPD